MTTVLRLRSFIEKANCPGIAWVGDCTKDGLEGVAVELSTAEDLVMLGYLLRAGRFPPPFVREVSVEPSGKFAFVAVWQHALFKKERRAR